MPPRINPRHEIRRRKFETTVTADKSATVVAEDDKSITVKSLTTELKGLPRTAVAGGAPIDFDVVVTNPSPSNYTNLSNLIYAEPQTTLQVQQADGSWTKLTGVPSTQPGGRVHYYLDGHDSTLAAGATITKHVRLTYAADTPLGDSYVIPRILVNEGTDAYGTPMGPQGTAIKIVSASTVVVPASDTTTTATATTATAVGATVRTTGTTTALASTGQLAQTGSGGITAAAATAFALLASGLGALWQVRRRRSA
ncbi:hypothetical protein [Kitasatospora sp. NPDC050543]|uniref:hypothetical protein n=1 Tax=Kitasatospora sp. NPDC050543 TaxID=3364054 RepID=UPI0037A4CCC8